MTDIVNGKGPRDVFVGLISKAIDTGVKVEAGSRPRDMAFHAGRISAFVHAAAMLADQMYGCDFLEARHAITKEIEDIHMNASDDDLKDTAYVGQAATEISMRVLQEV
jgi:hypothetical protein